MPEWTSTSRTMSAERRGYAPIASRRKSFAAAIVSTPANPPPATRMVSRSLRWAAAHSKSASSSTSISRFRSAMASPSDFIVSARSSRPGRPKKLVTLPSASTR